VTPRRIRLWTLLTCWQVGFWLLAVVLFAIGAWMLQEAANGVVRLTPALWWLAILAVVLSGLGLVVIRLIGHILGDELIRPMDQLLEVLRSLRAGGLNARLQYRGHVAELHALATLTCEVAENVAVHEAAMRAESQRSLTSYRTMLSALEDSEALAERLRQSERHYRQLAEAMPQIVWSCNPEGYTDYFNQRWYGYTGLTVDQSLGWGWLSTIHPDDSPHAEDVWQTAVRTGTNYEVEYRIRRADGVYRWHLGRGVAARDSAGLVVRWYGTCTDFEDRKRIEEQLTDLSASLEQKVAERTRELERKNRELKALDQLKDQFLSVVSHELRTPINAITGFGSILEDEVAGPLSAEQHRYLGRLLEGADRLLTLVNDLLDMSRIQAGRFHLDLKPMVLPNIVRQVVDALRPLAEQKGLGLGVEPLQGLPVLSADAQRIEQVLTNLVANAIKFTERGHVTIRACVEGQNLRCEVEDTGPGIAPDDQAKLFRQFGQLDTSYTRRAGGTGLGLSISKGLVEAHGGRIGVESQSGQGSCFWFTLPCATSPSLS
jgi:hypothetical protein